MDDVKQRLEEMRDSIEERRGKLARHVDHREEPLPQDFAEQAVELENDETMVALQQELTAELEDVNRALARLAEGTYGSCVRCGNDIGAGRLQALPSASLCIGCAEAAIDQATR